MTKHHTKKRHVKRHVKKGGQNDIEMGPPINTKPIYSIPSDTNKNVKESITPISQSQALQEFNRGPPDVRQRNENLDMFSEDSKENPMISTMPDWGQDAGRKRRTRKNKKHTKSRKSRKHRK